MTPEETLSIQELVSSGIAEVGHLQRYLHNQHGRWICKQTIMNCRQRLRGMKSAASDAATLLGRLQAQQEEDSGAILRFCTDTNGCLTRLFWVNSQQRTLLFRFGDVLINDSTCKTNRFGLALNLTMIVDGSNSSRLVAFALLAREDKESFAWLFDCLSEALPKLPIVFLSDADPAAIVAFNDKWGPYGVLHRMCVFHVNINIAANLKGSLGSDFGSFAQDFSQTRKQETEAAFEAAWRKLEDDYPKARPYLKRLYDRHHAWAHHVVDNFFSAGLCSTSR